MIFAKLDDDILHISYAYLIFRLLKIFHSPNLDPPVYKWFKALHCFSSSTIFRITKNIRFEERKNNAQLLKSSHRLGLILVSVKLLLPEYGLEALV